MSQRLRMVLVTIRKDGVHSFCWKEFIDRLLSWTAAGGLFRAAGPLKAKFCGAINYDMQWWLF